MKPPLPDAAMNGSGTSKSNTILLVITIGVLNISMAFPDEDSEFSTLRMKAARTSIDIPGICRELSANFPKLDDASLDTFRKDLQRRLLDIEGDQLEYKATKRARAKAEEQLQWHYERLKKLSEGAISDQDRQKVSEAEIKTLEMKLPGLNALEVSLEASCTKKVAAAEEIVLRQMNLESMSQEAVWSWLACKPPHLSGLLIAHLTSRENIDPSLDFIQNNLLTFATGRANAIINKNVENIIAGSSEIASVRSLSKFNLSAYEELVASLPKIESSEDKVRMAALVQSLRDMYSYSRMVAILVLEKIGSNEARTLLQSFAKSPMSKLEEKCTAEGLQHLEELRPQSNNEQQRP